MSRDEVLSRVREIMVELFELEPELVVPQARVFEDLELDSIDAIDLVARLQDMTGTRVPEDAIKQVRTVDDIVALACDELSRGGTAPDQDAKAPPSSALEP